MSAWIVWMFMSYWDSDYCVCVMLHDVRMDCVDVHGLLGFRLLCLCYAP